MKQSTEPKCNYRIKLCRRKNIEGLLGLMKLKRGETLYSNKKLRTHKNDFQRAVLGDVFSLTKFPTSETREDLALILNHTIRGIQIWFQNNRHNNFDSSPKQNKFEIENDRQEMRNLIDDPFKNKKKGLDRTLLCDILEKYYNGKLKGVWKDFIDHIHSEVD